MDKIKEAFQKVKEDIESLKYSLTEIKQELNSLKKDILDLKHPIQAPVYDSNMPNQDNLSVETLSTHYTQNPAFRHTLSTNNSPFYALKPQNFDISTGNQGVSTDRQTDRQTNQQTQNTPNFKKNSFEDAVKILDSLDSIKKEIRLMFKKLTEREMAVFSAIYQIEEEKGFADYSSISSKLGISESSVRDYVIRLIKKGIPVEKTKINNKIIHLNVSKDMKKIAPLSVIIQLRDL